jgi:large subunit ribosomal protein L23
MADLKYYDIILKPVVTEKSMNDMANKRYAFYVHIDSTKNQIREAVEKMFEGVRVDSVNTFNLKGKKRRTRTYKYGTTVKRKKAIVTLKEGEQIDLFKNI